MLFVVKSYKAKKCNNGADHSLCLVSFVFLCNGKTIYRVQIFVRTVSKKKRKRGTTETNTNIKHQRISLRKLVKAAFFLKSQGMAKASKKNFLTYFFFYHDNIAEQIILDRLETAERQLRVTHHIVSSVERKKK